MKNRKLLYTALSASLLLAACGTDTSDEDNVKQPVENTDQAGESNPEGSDATENGTDSTQGTENKDEDTTKEEDATNEEGTEEDTTNDTESEADGAEDVSPLEGAVETDSDEQNFKIQVLPAYELTSEEPGRDILYLKEQEDKYMVIRTIPASETNFDDAVENMKETLAATSTDATPVELTDSGQLPSDKKLEKVQAYRVTNEGGPIITAMIFQKGDMVVRVMMYDDNEESYYEEFLKMTETIEAK